MPIHRTQRRETRPVVLDDLTDATLHVVTPQHFQDDVLRADPVGQRTAEPYAENFRHFEIERFAGHGESHVESAGAEGQHAQRSGGRRMGVGTDERLAGFAESFLMHGMADAVARSRIPHAEFFAGRLQEDVIVRVFVVRLQEIVIDVLHGTFRSHALDAHGFEFEHHERTGGVLRQGLVDADADLAAGLHFAFDEMRLNQFLCDVECL